jgi:hypothetical protein
MFKYYNPQLIHSKRSYTVEKFCNVYKDKKLHAQTVRGWVNSGELEVISKKPIIIYGAVAKSFLEQRNKAHKKTLDFDQIKCVRCKQSSSPKNKEITIYQNKNGSWKAAGFCQHCEREISRFYKKDERQKLAETFITKQPELMTLCNKSDTASKTHLKEPQKIVSSEPYQDVKQDSTTTNSKTNIGEQLTLF